ncbi:MAG TPA: TrmH family RNA methyltransferase [Candidatus Saccharimonadales bacterium]|jgi:tRNA G18 (ribose-2'-O)-methylase SpoU
MARISNKRTTILIADNIRSTHNVGSLFRTAEGLGVSSLILTGYTPYPKEPGDKRLEHLALKLDKQINKTALGAQNSLEWQHASDINAEITMLKKLGFRIYALEQHPKSQDLTSVKPADKAALVVGNELTGIEADVLKLCDDIIEIPMFGKKESFNVVQAAAMALFYFRFY